MTVQLHYGTGAAKVGGNYAASSTRQDGCLQLLTLSTQIRRLHNKIEEALISQLLWEQQ